MRPSKILLLAALLAAAGGAGACRRPQEPPSEKTAAVKTLYQCPMHPDVIRDRPGECPICHMKLQPVETLEAPQPEARPRAAFKLSPQRQQLIGVAFGEAELMDMEKVVRASGRVAYDPALYSAIEEYRQALQTARSFPSGASAEARSLTESIARSTKMKLRLQGLSDSQITELSRKPAEASQGLVLGSPGGSVWVYAEVYESEINLVKPGQVMQISSPALPGRVFTAKVLSVDPVVSPLTRTARVRGEVGNPEGKFRPEMYLEVKIKVPLGRRLAVARDAVLDTGESQIVFVASGDGAFEPRQVRLGDEAEGYVVVQEGLEPGEKVVTSANFLIDSESQFRAAAEAFRAGRAGHQH